MDSVLIAARGEQNIQTLSALLRRRYSHAELLVAKSGGMARQIFNERSLKLLVVSTPLSDESGVELAIDAANRDIGVLLLTMTEYAEDFAAQAGEKGVFVLEKPFSKAFFDHALRFIESSVGRVEELRRQYAVLQAKFEEQRIVSQAKFMLIQVHSFTEEEAHKYIEKQAMDLRLTRRNVAENVLRNFNTPFQSKSNIDEGVSE